MVGGEKRERGRRERERRKKRERKKGGEIFFTSSTDQTGSDSACPSSASCLPRPLPSSAATQSESAERRPTRWPEASWREREEGGGGGGGAVEEVEAVGPAAQASSAAAAAAAFKSASSEMSLFFEVCVFVCARYG